MPKPKTIFFVLLVLSLFGNAYLFLSVTKWQKAWEEQIMTTSIIERILIGSGADVSFDAIHSIVKEKFEGAYEVNPLQESDIPMLDADKNVILVYETKLYFRKGLYVGSKANLPIRGNWE